MGWWNKDMPRKKKTSGKPMMPTKNKLGQYHHPKPKTCSS
jgi:hypothetical protein